MSAMASVIQRKKRRRVRSPAPKPPIVANVNLVKTASYEATWQCACGSANTVHFFRRLVIGHVLNGRLVCGACGSNYRGMFITGMEGRR